MFSGKVQKWNPYGLKQDRNLIVTNERLYNFKKKKLRRAIKIADLAGVTKSLYPGNTSEFVIHVNSDYDLRLRCDMRDEVFNTLKLNYLTLCKENLPVYGIVKAKSLSDFATTEKDVARGISRIPILLARIYEEDVHIEKNPKYRVPLSPTSAGME